MEFHNGNGTIFLIGSYDAVTHSFERERVQAVDYGLHFYAPPDHRGPGRAANRHRLDAELGHLRGRSAQRGKLVRAYVPPP